MSAMSVRKTAILGPLSQLQLFGRLNKLGGNFISIYAVADAREQLHGTDAGNTGTPNWAQATGLPGFGSNRAQPAVGGY